jgi:hypothetical protein
MEELNPRGMIPFDKSKWGESYFAWWYPGVDRIDKYCDLNYFVSCISKVSRYAIAELADIKTWI